MVLPAAGFSKTKVTLDERPEIWMQNENPLNRTNQTSTLTLVVEGPDRKGGSRSRNKHGGNLSFGLADWWRAGLPGPRYRARAITKDARRAAPKFKTGPVVNTERAAHGFVEAGLQVQFYTPTRAYR